MRQRRLLIPLWLAASILLVTGCDKDKNAPRIVTLSPAPNSVSAERQGVNSPLVVAQFNEALLESSVPNDSIKLEYNGDVLPGVFAYSPSINTIAFEPLIPLFFLREYNVSVKSGISDLDGNSTKTGLEWSFHVRDGTFRRSVLGEGFPGNAGKPQIAFGPNQHGQIIWSQANSEGRINIRARAIEGRNFSDPYDALASPILIEDKDDDTDTPDTGDAISPQIAVDSLGNAIAVWVQSIGGESRILTNRYTHDDEDPTGTWGNTLSLTSLSDPGSDAALPQIAIGPNGNAIAVWTQDDGRVYANLFIKSTGLWQGATPIDADGTGTPTGVQIVIDADNNAIAVWPENNRIYAARYTGTWAASAPIDNGSGTAATEPQIAINPAGNDAIAVWAQSDGTRNNIWGARFNGSTWEAPSLLETRSGNAQTPQVAMNAQGNAFAIWSQATSSTSTRFRIYVSRFDGTNWTPESDPIDNFSAATYVDEIAERGSSTQPQIVIDGDGNAIAVWTVDGDGDDILAFTAANRYRGPMAHEDLRGWIAAGLIDVTTAPYTKDASNPQIAITADFTAMAVWEKKDEDDIISLRISSFY